MKKISKTNAMRILDQKKIGYSTISYDTDDGFNDGVSVANKVGKNPSQVYKTLVTQGSGREYFVFVVPVAGELDLKKAARAAGEKKIEMIPMKNLLSVTGYVKGGCSPVGMKKALQTFLNASAQELDLIVVSGGKVGLQIELPVADLMAVAGAEFADLAK